MGALQETYRKNVLLIHAYQVCIGVVGLFLVFSSCSRKLSIPHSKNAVSTITGTSFYEEAVQFNWRQRDSFFLESFYRGNVPKFLYTFTPITIEHQDTLGNKYKIQFYCSTDYVSVGNDQDWARVPLSPMAAQVLADRLHCFLPTRKMVDRIYQQSKVKLAPVPMYAYRDSTITMWQHHLIIEGQRKGRGGLISGIKKDIVICSEEQFKGKDDRVAIYGWHRLDSRPIQPLYTGHINWYVDYSHGVRLIYRAIKVNHKWVDYIEFFNNPLLNVALSDEKGKLVLRY